jgi:hypothetical protein
MNGMGGHVNPHRQPGEKVFIPPEQLHGVCRDYHGKSAHLVASHRSRCFAY